MEIKISTIPVNELKNKKLLDDDPDNKIQPDNGIVHYDLGVAYVDVCDILKARTQVKALKKLNKKYLALQLEKKIKIEKKEIFSRSRQARKQGKLDLAITMYRNILKLYPDHTTVNYELGTAYVEQGKIKSARKQVKKLNDLGKFDSSNRLTEQINR